MNRFVAAALAAVAGAVLAPIAASAEGNIASKATHLELNVNGRDLTYSQTEFQLETGKYYILDVTSDGVEELMVRMPDLFRNSWINQIVINDIEVHTSGAVYGVEFDDEGTASISFVPIRPGNYEFFSPGFEDRGLKGTFIVR